MLLFGIEALKGRLRREKAGVGRIVKAGGAIEAIGLGERQRKNQARLEMLPACLIEGIENALAGQRGHPENRGQIVFGIAGRKGIDTPGRIGVVGRIQRPYGVGAARKPRGKAGPPFPVLNGFECGPGSERNSFYFFDREQRITLLFCCVVEPQNRFPFLLTTLLTPIAAVDIDIAVGQIACIDSGTALAEPDIDADRKLFAFHITGCGLLGVIGRAFSVAGKDVLAEGNRELVAVGRLAGLAHCHDNASPIGVLAGNRGFDEGAVGNGAGDLCGAVIGRGAGDVDGDELGRPLAVAHHLHGE